MDFLPLALSDYIDSNAIRLQMTVERFSWIDDWFPGYFDHSVRIQVPTIGAVSGRGIARDLDLSITKASAECFERTFFLAAEQSTHTTNGLAVHTTLTEAA
jgi:hypothetical protein